ncbi:TRAF family member-associated NF-kappa-B activator isoform X1 [Ochotona curzoniae]|uniref:TRAF family member-associated NF-kappa-B activator isoform X1 n=1 Tax=Ochotona curzoniae TaxID=130825 RepID=UPI001B34B4AD|nr:TRAF family member-associated NF-kappa-B activator isoform X1 [Ochotona curzoniae]XP_040827564.1 TRAF family member-associated NF-kappa-B activator isoform X1 [Ochotona curzoniae]XP_040827565.1 TRAF family member-associated NF-kappa-B activator isoform X1 [Ochotona curzoniae]XP_040827566.1 TRAF family member-associated NF-kappa-B activator isoform X1 [Ochotona curzoniae]XP_040827567.1 TRAF family member-associated NF-kappa-B activator isoform X1 [Ochotona curzoniae]XP_040827568.1 TRAF famil
MDKNIGEQLNKAYEAFRQACMDRDNAVRELQQKTESYEQRIREQQEQLSVQQAIIDKLQSQLLLVNSNRDDSYGYLPLPEDSGTKNNLTFDQPHDKVKLGATREKQSKVHLPNASSHQSLAGTESRSWELNPSLPQSSMVRNQELSSPRKETSARSLGVPLFHERGNVEKTFWDLKEEFHRICLLAKAQKDHLSKLNIPNTAIETQCSVPIQCTDKTDKQEALFKPQAKDDINRGTPCITSVTARGLGRDEEDTSIESLSKLNVKFPPVDSDSTFLHSTSELPNILGAATSEAMCQDILNMELRDNPGHFADTEETAVENQGIDPIASAIQNLKTTDKTKTSDLVNICIRTTPDRAARLPPGDHNALYVNTFPPQDSSDAPFPSLSSPGKAIRGPQQPIWKPFPNQENDLVVLSGTDSELHIPRVCEFCQAVFPPSITSRGDFLRHLNSHFNGET